jgi:hypothetical protein
MPAPPEKILDDIEILQGKLRTIEAGLEEMKRKVRAGQKISPAELDMTVKDIDRLKALMDEQKRDGH